MPSHLCRRVCGSFAAFTAALILVAYAPVAGAATCGDDVGGVRIPCACGDVVVADTRLRSGDPVVTMKCSGDGLLLRAPAEAESLRLDLGGHSLIGEGYGNGVRVIDGGSNGAVIVGAEDGEPGAIANFATGLRALNPRMLAEVRNLRLVGNKRDGAHVRTHHGVIENVTAVQNGRDGIRVGGRAPTLERVESKQNRGYGVLSFGRETALDATTGSNTRGSVRGPRKGPLE